jgi:hypothetical protein
LKTGATRSGSLVSVDIAERNSDDDGDASRNVMPWRDWQEPRTKRLRD